MPIPARSAAPYPSPRTPVPPAEGGDPPALKLFRPDESDDADAWDDDDVAADDSGLIVAPDAPAANAPLTLAAIALATLAGILFTMLTGCQMAANSQNTTGAALYNQGQYTTAMQHFQKAIQSNPTHPDGYYNLAATTHRLGNQRKDANLLRQSEALYNQALDHDANHIDAHRGLAVLLVDSGRPDRAFALMKNWASQNPTSAEPRVELARLYEEHGEPRTALKYLEDAVQQNPQHPRAWLALARLRESSGDPVQALQNYQRALAVGNGLGGNQPLVVERVAALSRQLNASRDAAYSNNNTQIASPASFGSTRY